jgi:hypothetical protein
MLTFQTGTFHKLKAIATFNFGPLGGITITEGTPMEFDGMTLKMGGKDHGCAEFKLALKAKFVVPVTDQTSTYQPVAAQVEVKSATSHGETREKVKMGVAIEEEQVVGSVSGTKGRREAAQSARDVQVQAPAPKVAAQAPAAVPRNLTVEQADALNSAALRAELDKPVDTNYVKGGTLQARPDEDTGSSGRRVGAGGKFGLQMADGGHQGVVVGSVKSGLNSAKVGAEGEATRKGGTDMTKVTAQSVEAGLKPQKIIEGIKGLEAKSGSLQTGIRNVGVQVMSGEGGIVHHPPKPMVSTTVVTEGEDIRSVVGGVTGDVREARGSDEGLAALLPDAIIAEPPTTLKAAGGRVAPQQSDPEDEIQGILEGWDKKRQWRKRVIEAVDFYGDWPEALAAIYSIESPAVVKHIKAGVAKQAAEAG